MVNIDQDKMQQVIQQAFDRAAGNRRWEKAIVRAMQQLESNPYAYQNLDLVFATSEGQPLVCLS
jgi:hypothetical protein